MSNRILNAVNSNGTFSYDSNGYFLTNNKNTNITSKNDISLNSQTTSIITNTFNLNTENIINISSKNNTNGAILFESYSQNGGITLKTNKEGEINLLSNNVNLNASNGNIALGQKCEDSNLDKLTQSVSIDALRKVSINTEDFYTIASDSINFISQTGDITFGSQIGQSFIKFENNNLLINQQTSPHNRILDIHVNKEDDLDNNNGILLYSSQPDINCNVKLENDVKNNLQIGLTSSQSTNENNLHNIKDYNIEKTLIGYQIENTIYLKTFIDNDDINKSIVWDNEVSHSKLLKPIKYELQPIKCNSDFEINASLINNDVSFINVGNNTKTIIGIVIYINNENEFNWSYIDKNNNILSIYNKNNNINENIKITKEPFILNNIKVIFPTITGYNIGDYWRISLIQTVKVSKKLNISLQKCHMIKNKIGYVSTSNNELQLITSKKTRMRISSEGGISFNDIDNNNNISPHTFNIYNSLNKEYYVSIGDSFISQSCHNILQLNNGGYIISWEEKYSDYSHIFLKRYNADGTISPNSKKQIVNTNKTGYHQQPNISNNNNSNNTNNIKENETFIVVWSKLEITSSENNNNNNIYNLYAQIFINYKKKKGFDIPLGRIYNNKNAVNIKSTRLNNGSFAIVWCGEDNNIGHFSIYGLILDVGGNIIKNRFQISETNSHHSYLNPHIYNININNTNNTNNTNNNYSVLYYTKNKAHINEYNNEIYDIKYKILNENNIKLSQQNLVSFYNSFSVQLQNNCLYVSTFEPLFLNDKFNENDIYKIISINHYNTVNINIKLNNIEDNIINVSSKDLKLLNINDIISIKQIYTSQLHQKSFLYNAKIDLIDNENNIIVLSKTTINLSLYKYDLIDNNFILNNKIHNIHNNNIIPLNVNIKENLFCDLSITCIGDLCLVWGRKNIGVFITLISNNLETYIYANKLFNIYRGVNDIKINSIYSKEKCDSGLILSYNIDNNDNNDNNNIMYKCIDLYNDIFSINDNNNNNGLIINGNGYIRIGKNDRFNNFNESNLHINGSMSSKIITISNLKKYVVNHSDNTILVDASYNDILIILDNNHTYYGRKYVIKYINGTYKVIINSPSLIDGKYSQILTCKWESIEIQSNGKEWYILK